MEETISTPTESTQEQTPLDVTENSQPVEQQTPETANQELVNDENVAEIAEEVEQPKEQINWEKRAKDNQAEFTRVSQELAELKKQMAQNQPKYVDEKGKITPEYQQNRQREIDLAEFTDYYNYSRHLGENERLEVEQLLAKADRAYNPADKTAYEQIMNQVENYFDSRLVKQISLNKKEKENNMQADFDKMTQEHRLQKSREFASLVEQSEDLKALLYQESENYSPEVFGIAKQMLDLTGGIDFDVFNKAVSSIKALGVKEHLAQQKANAEKQKASVPTGQAVQVNTQLLTRDYAVNNYAEAVKKYGMDKVDEIIMKG